MFFGVPAGNEDEDEYERFYRPDHPSLISMSSAFAAAMNFYRRPGHPSTVRTVHTRTPKAQHQPGPSPPWHNRPYGRKMHGQKHCKQGPSRRWLTAIPYTNRSLHSPRNSIVNTYKLYSKNYNLAVRRNVIEELDLATTYKSFKVLTIQESK